MKLHTYSAPSKSFHIIKRVKLFHPKSNKSPSAFNEHVATYFVAICKNTNTLKLKLRMWKDDVCKQHESIDHVQSFLTITTCAFKTEEGTEMWTSYLRGWFIRTYQTPFGYGPETARWIQTNCRRNNLDRSLDN